jgi:hypothetical protein
MVLELDTEVQGPLLAGGRATDIGVEVAERYKKVKDLLDTLEAEREMLRGAILAAADEFPGTKSFPAGDLIIRVSQSTRESVPLAQVRTQQPEIYEALVAAGLVNRTVARTLSVK